MLRPNCLVRVHKNDSFPWFHFKCDAGDKLATICHLFLGKREGREVTQLFLPFFFPKRKILGPTGLDLQSEPLGDWESNTFTTIPYFPVVREGSGDPYTRESQIVLFSPARWQRDSPLSLDNTFETDSTWCQPPDKHIISFLYLSRSRFQ